MVELFQSMLMLSAEGPLPPPLDSFTFARKENKLYLTDHAGVLAKYLKKEAHRYFVYNENSPILKVSDCLPPGFKQLPQLAAFNRSLESRYGLLIMDLEEWLSGLRSLKNNQAVWNGIMANRYVGPHFSGLLELMEYAKSKSLNVAAGRHKGLILDVDGFDGSTGSKSQPG
jgi:hypothetical protein